MEYGKEYNQGDFKINSLNFSVWVKSNQASIEDWAKKAVSGTESVVHALGGIKGILIFIAAWKSAGFILEILAMGKAIKELGALSALATKKSMLLTAIAGAYYVAQDPKGAAKAVTDTWSNGIASLLSFGSKMHKLLPSGGAFSSSNPFYSSTKGVSANAFMSGGSTDNSRSVIIQALTINAPNNAPQGFAKALQDSINSVLVVNANTGTF